MTSPRQRAANRKNAQRSTAPKTAVGRRRSAQNALTHGLTGPIEDSFLGQQLVDIASLLEGDGLSPTEALSLSRLILEYERNLQHQRTLFTHSVAAQAGDLSKSAEMGVLFNSAEMIGQELKREDRRQLAEDAQYARAFKAFFLDIARSIRTDRGNAVREIKSADRYLRRAANQMIKTIRLL